MNVNLDQNMANKVAETAKNITRIAANLTDKPAPKPPEKKQENMNQPHTQTVEVKVGDTGSANPKPTVIHEKKETHVHKTYPDSRELSAAECEVETLRIRNEHELKMKELEFRMLMEEQNRKERKEREEYDRKERERRREKDRRYAKYAYVGFGIAGAAALGYVAYDLYTNSRYFKDRRMALQAGTVEAEGNVK